MMMAQRSMMRTLKVVKVVVKERQIPSVSIQIKEKKGRGNPKKAFSRKVQRILEPRAPLMISRIRCLKRPQNA